MKAYLTGTSNYVIKVKGEENYKTTPTPSIVSFWHKDENNNISYSYGNVGINTTNPTVELEVIGTIKATDFDSLSDKNLKENIKLIDNPLEKLISINGVSFDWKDTKTPSMGVIAQEIEEIFPELVNTADYKSVNYNGLIGVLIEAVKDLKEEVDELKGQINTIIRNEIS